MGDEGAEESSRGARRDMGLQKLLLSEDRMIDIIEHSLPIVLYSAKPDEHFSTLMVTARIEEITGYPPPHFAESASFWVELIHEGDRESVLAAMECLIEQRAPVTLEYRITHRTGETRWIKDVAVPVLDDGEVIRVDGFIEDVTERKSVEERLRRSEERFRQILEHSHEGIISTDAEGRITFINRSMAGMLGYTSEEMLGRPLRFFTDSDDRSGALGDAGSGVGPGEAREIQLLRRDGDKLHALISVSPLVEEVDQGSIAFVLDLTEKKVAERNLRDREEIYRLARKASKLGSWSWDIGTGKLRWSEEIEPIFGFGRGEFPGTIDAFSGRIHPDDRERVWELIDRCIERGSDYYTEHRIVWPDGTVRWMLEMGDVIKDSDGRPVRMVGVVKDISDHKESEEEIRQLNLDLIRRTEELAAINEELEAFTYSVSHDLKAPLRTIEGFCVILLDEYRDAMDEEGREYLSRLRAASEKMSMLIDELLKLSRATMTELSKERFSMSEMVQEIAFQYLAVEPDREVEFDIQPGVVAFGDTRLIEVALSSLIDNAWKFTRERRPARIEFGVIEREGVCEYYVRDNGAGFDMRHSDKLFKPFQRLHSQREFPGTGVGLGIVRRIVRRHGGEVWGEGEVGKGATFFFTLQEWDAPRSSHCISHGKASGG